MPGPRGFRGSLKDQARPVHTMPPGPALPCPTPRRPRLSALRSRPRTAGQKLGSGKRLTIACHRSTRPLASPPPAILPRRSGLAGPEPQPTSRAPRSPACELPIEEEGSGTEQGVRFRYPGGPQSLHQVSRRGARLQRFPHGKPPRSGAAAVSPADHSHKETKGLNLGQKTWLPKCGHRCEATARGPQK